MPAEIDPTEIDVWTQVRSPKFHLSKACAGSPATRVPANLVAAVNAQRKPCKNCVNDEAVIEEYRRLVGRG